MHVRKREREGVKERERVKGIYTLMYSVGM